jgi:hypothetical protein
VATIYQRVLQDRFGQLPAVLQLFLGNESGGQAAGRLKVTRAAGRCRNLAARALGIPPAGDYDFRLEVTPCGAGQRWVRWFGGHALTTRQDEHQGLLVESAGPGTVGFALTVVKEVLVFHPRRVWLFGVPMPLGLAPSINVENAATGSGGWRVRVRIGLPWLGLVGEYEGEVKPVRGPATEPLPR